MALAQSACARLAPMPLEPSIAPVGLVQPPEQPVDADIAGEPASLYAVAPQLTAGKSLFREAGQPDAGR